LEYKTKDLELKRHLVDLTPFLVILFGYIGFIFIRYWMFPVSSDGLAFCYVSAFPEKAFSVFTRFFNLYLTKMIVFPFDNLLRGYALASLLYHVGTIIFAYLIAKRLAGKVQGLLAAIFTALCPFFFAFATEYFSDAPCLFFGLGALYFSIIGNSHSKNYLKYFFSGFLLAASLFSKPFGIVFIIPVMINLLSSRLWKKMIYFLMGILGVMLFIALNDYIWLGDFIFHLNPRNYFLYKNIVSVDLAGLNNMSSGRPLDITDGWLIAYLIFFMAYLYQGMNSLKNRGNFNWKNRGSFSLALAGFSLIILFARTSFLHPGWWVQSHYSYCLIVPWIVAFCSFIRFIEEPESKKGKPSKSDFMSGLLSILFVITLFTTKNSHIYSLSRLSFGRFFYLFSLWILIFAITLILITGNYLHRNGYRKTAAFFFLIGCIGIMWHNANWAAKFSSEAFNKKEYIQTNAFLEKYRDLLKKAPVIPIHCNVSRSFELFASLRLAKLIDEKNIKSFIEKRNLQSVIRANSAPFYVLTKKDDADSLAQEANAQSRRVISVQNGSFFDCSFYLISHLDQVDKEILFKSHKE